jgi:hypothetical protein
MNTRVKFDKITGVFVWFDAKVVSELLFFKKKFWRRRRKNSSLSPAQNSVKRRGIFPKEHLPTSHVRSLPFFGGRIYKPRARPQTYKLIGREATRRRRRRYQNSLVK